MNKKLYYLIVFFLVCTFWPQLYAQEDNLFTEAGNYYVSNKGNNKYVVIDAANYNAAASAEDKDDADIVTLAFDDNGIVTTMKNLYGDGDMIAILEQVKSVLKTRLDNHDLNSDFVEEMFKIKLVMTGDEKNSMYFCFDIPEIEDIEAIRDYLLNEGGVNNQLVKDYLDLLLQPGQRVYLCIADENGAFSFTQDNNLDAAKWIVEKYVIHEETLFTEAGDYYVSNKGNDKYVVIDADHYNAAASAENKDDANVITLAFDDNGIVTTMENRYGDGDMIAILEQVKSVLRNRLDNHGLNSDFVEEMFRIKLVMTDDEVGSIYFCFDIPEIEDIEAIRDYLLNEGGVNNQLVKDYLDLLLQPGQRVYLCITDENGALSFTQDKDLDLAKWIVEEYIIPEDDLFTEAGDYYVSNNGNNKYVVIDAENYNATASAEDIKDADVITIDFDDNGIVSTMAQKDGTGDMIATLNTVKDVLRSKLEQNNMDASFVDEMFDIKLVKTGDSDNSLYFCFDIPRINNLTAIHNYLNGAISNERVKAYLEVLLQPGKRIYLNIVDENGTFGFTRDKAAASSKWMVASEEEQSDTTKHDPALYLSNTLPVLYINTVDETPIVDKENYIPGSYYLDANGCGDYSSIGSEEEPLPLQIKGRGNATWRLPKKPYRLKLDKKAALLGMPKSKHWVLLADYADWLAHGRNYLIFKMSKKMGMPFTSECIPCEVVLNGDYIGMYFLTEQIRVDKDRVNITEQVDGETNPENITGGWLLEIDNYKEDNQIRFPDPKKDNKVIRITYHSPEDLSEEQLNYLTDFMYKVNDAVNTNDKTSTEWEEYIDIDALARFYVLEEAADNLEAFSGSSWFYKDRGDSTKLIWGPHWDSGSCLGNRNMDNCNFLYLDEPRWATNHWIKEICKFPRFQVAIRSWWHKYRDEVFPTMQQEVNDYGVLTEQALASDYLRWGDKSATQLAYYRKKFMRMLTNKYNFLASRWNDPVEGITLSELMTEGFVGTEYIINDDLAVVNATENGNRVFVTDGDGHWLQVLANDYYNQLATCSSIGTLRGIFTGNDYIPLFYLTAEPEINDASLTVTPQNYNINTDFCPIVNEVIRLSGTYNANSSTLRATDDDIALTLDTSWIPDWSIDNGKKCIIEGVAQIKEPWPMRETMLNSFEFPYQNFIIYPLEVETPTAISNIEDSNDGNAIINVVNMQGQVIKQGVKRSEATQGLPPGIYLIGHKKVVIRR